MDSTRDQKIAEQKRKIEEKIKARELYARGSNFIEREIKELEAELADLYRQKPPHITLVDENFSRSEYEVQKIKRHMRREAFTHRFRQRERRINAIRETDRNAEMKINFDSKEEVFYVKILSTTIDLPTLIFKKWDTIGIRSTIESDHRPQIPWKKILSGENWKENVIVSPYFLDNSSTLNNVVRLKKQADPNLTGTH